MRNEEKRHINEVELVRFQVWVDVEGKVRLESRVSASFQPGWFKIEKVEHIEWSMELLTSGKN